MANLLLVVWVLFGFFLQKSFTQSLDDEWGEWSPCSRSCGVGVSSQDRKCLDVTDDGSCPEPRRKYRTCNIQDCPAESGDYRYEQCASFNNRTLQGKKYKWVPYIPERDPCTLNCMPKGEYFYYRWAAKVVDGTKCSPDSYDICVNGKCEPLGCDLIMHSKAKEDKCRVCNGNGENCRTITGKFTGVGDGYKEFAVIPSSATNIVITEEAPAGHFLALADSKGNFFLNGDFDVTNPRTYKIAGSLFRYERSSSGKEEIRSLGPISQPVHAHILMREGHNNPGVSYEFSIPKSIKELPKLAKYSWKTSNYGSCSATCAGGYQYRKITCLRDRDNKEVPPYQCDAKTKPATKRDCNTQPCPPSWFISGWTACSTTCGQGKQVRRVHCEHVVQGGESKMIPDERCTTSKPIAMRVCSKQRYCPVWSVTRWSQCSVSCGDGIITRKVRCRQVSINVNDNIYLPDEGCDVNIKPTTTARCNPGPCTVKWIASDWSLCYPKCGRGISTRMVYCVSVTDHNQKYPDTLCDNRTRPTSRKECFSSEACPPMWHGSQWSGCTASCGVGMQMRNVICAVREINMLRIISRDQCNASYAMPSVRKCSTKPCQAGWYIYPWQPCSKSCGIGIRRRKVKCFADSSEVPDERWCDQKTKPTEVEVCTVQSCQSATLTPRERTTEKPTTERPITERQTTERPTTERPTTRRRTTEKQTTKRPTTERPTTERQTTEKPTTKRRTTVKPTTKRRTTEKPTTERQTTNDVTTKQRVTKPSTKRTTEVKITKRPTTEPREVITQRHPDEDTTTRRTRPRITIEPTTIIKIPAKIVEAPRDKVRFVGSEVYLRCRATGIPPPKITWRKGMFPVSSLGERYQMLAEGTLYIDKVRPEDEGTYTCFAGNFVGSMDRRVAELRVIVPVSVKIRPSKRHEVSAGQQVVLGCNVQGKPTPQVYWYKDGSLFDINSPRISTTSQRITISSARVRDSGRYECRASNDYSQATDLVVLTVKGEEPVIPTTPQVCEDNPVIADCSIIKIAGYCTNDFYQQACCKTCSKHPSIRN